MEIATRTLIAGATGYIGGRIAAALSDSGASVRCLVRDRGKAKPLEDAGFELHVGDVTDAASLIGAARDVDVAYYLVHAMGGGAGFAKRETAAARNFARAASEEGVGGSSTWVGSATRPRLSTCAAATRPHGSSPPRARRSPTSGRRWSLAPAASPSGRCATWWDDCR